MPSYESNKEKIIEDVQTRYSLINSLNREIEELKKKNEKLEREIKLLKLALV